MNDDTIMLLGMYSKELLQEQRFHALIELYGQQCAADILSTQPHEAKKREGIHAAYVGFSEFLSLLSKFKEAYETLTKMNELDSAPEV